MVAQQAGRHRVLVDHQCRPCSNLHLLCCPNGLVSFRSFLLLASEVSGASEVTTLWRYSAFVGACLTRRGPTETYAPLAPHTHMTIMTRVCVCVSSVFVSTARRMFCCTDSVSRHWALMTRLSSTSVSHPPRYSQISTAVFCGKILDTWDDRIYNAGVMTGHLANDGVDGVIVGKLVKAIFSIINRWSMNV